MISGSAMPRTLQVVATTRLAYSEINPNYIKGNAAKQLSVTFGARLIKRETSYRAATKKSSTSGPAP